MFLSQKTEGMTNVIAYTQTASRISTRRTRHKTNQGYIENIDVQNVIASGFSHALFSASPTQTAVRNMLRYRDRAEIVPVQWVPTSVVPSANPVILSLPTSTYVVSLSSTSNVCISATAVE
ncbi:uncharacterized protein [Rutidosis leptorrhynchoides]|uniref:uncharacterized protein n=1 Tax=Rutidosis leptorrhynchoides TaxID=125765 RepID=UPI003A9A4609